MLPPSKTTVTEGVVSVEVDKQAPIASWKQESAYDSARACQAGIAGFANITIPDEMLPVFIAARCVPAEFVYSQKTRTPQ